MSHNRYDAVVIGAGNSGIVAALELAQAGKKTLLIEKNNTPGGCSTSFVRGRFEFDATLHEFCDWGPDDNKGSSRLLLEKLGLQTEWVPIPDVFRCVIRKDSTGKPLDVRMPCGTSSFIEAMEREVPGSRKSTEAFFALADEMTRATHAISASHGKADGKFLREQYPNFLRCAAHSTKKVLQALHMPKRAQDILGTYWSYLGMPLSRLAFLHYAVAMSHYIERGAYIPKLTAHANSTALMQLFYEAGGHALFSTEATKLLCEDGKIAGIETTAGTFSTEHVIGNLNPHTVFGKMLPADTIPKRALKLANSRRFGIRFFNVYLGLNRSNTELGLTDYSVFIADTADQDALFSRMGKIEGNDYVIFNCYNVPNPTCSPQGTCICTLTALFSEDAWGSLDPTSYRKAKEAYAAHLIELVEKTLGVSLRPHIEEIEIATPITFARYLGTPQGTAYGYEAPLWDSMMTRLMMLSKDAAVPGLYLTGAAGPRCHGNNMCYSAGDTAAKTALRAMAQQEQEGRENACR